MSDHEQINQAQELPSGYVATEMATKPLRLTDAEIPWVNQEANFGLVKCTLQSGKEFMLGSAVGSHPNFVSAAESMTEQQQANCDNMFYSRVAGYIDNNFNSPKVEAFPGAATAFPVRVLRNKGGQRVYFGVMQDPGTQLPVILKLAVCDKNMQTLITKVLTSTSERAHNRKSTK